MYSGGPNFKAMVASGGATNGGHGGDGGDGGAGAVGDPDGSGAAGGAPGAGGLGYNGGSAGAAGVPGTHGTDPLQFAVVSIGNSGNPSDQTPNGSFGAVDYTYSLARTETTVAEYAQFLNSVARYVPDDPQYAYLLDLWDKEMAVAPRGVVPDNGAVRSSVVGQQIIRTGTSGNYVYKVATDAGQLPIANVSWFNAARFVNWMNNGQPVFTTFVTDPGTETGAYTLDGNSTAVITTRNLDAKYWIPSENEWYKAAYYDPSKDGTGGYWKYPTRSNTEPYNGITPRELDRPNSANYNTIGHSEVPRLTPVGSFVNSASYYGTFDQAGNLWEWSDSYINNYKDAPNSMIIRGGSWSLGILNPDKQVRRDYTPDEVDDDTGFRIATSKQPTVTAAPATDPAGAPTTPPAAPAGPATPVAFRSAPGERTIAMVTVGNPNNPADSNGFGSVPYTYRIAKYETTVSEYVDFLNAVATSPTAPVYIQQLYQSEMASEKEKTGALILRSDNPDGSYSYAAAKDPVTEQSRADLPVAWVNWFGAARYANWMNNGGTATSDTETGAYLLNGAVTGVFERVATAKYWIPGESEWYKGAYYDPTKNGTGGYWTYATRSDTLPNDTPDNFLGTNSANYDNQRKKGMVLTPVGSYVNSASYYGTFDMTGNLWEWNDGIVRSPAPGTDEPDARIVRGGSWSQGIIAVSSSTRRDYPTGYQIPGYLYYTDDDTGFRLAGAVDLNTAL